jgi:hypothetical protein
MFSFALVGKVVLKIVCKVVFLICEWSLQSLNEFQWLALEAMGSWH